VTSTSRYHVVRGAIPSAVATIVTLAVLSVLCAYIIPDSGIRYTDLRPSTLDDAAILTRVAPDKNFVIQQHSVAHRQSFGRTEIFFIANSADRPVTESIELVRVEVGFPFRALSGEWWRMHSWNVGHDTQHVSTNGSSWAFRLDRDIGRRRLVFRPILWGLCGNAIVIFTIWFCAIRSAIALRHIRRRKRGCCTSCGYCLSNTDSRRCSECGSPIPGKISPG